MALSAGVVAGTPAAILADQTLQNYVGIPVL
jgi:hypothetical protein